MTRVTAQNVLEHPRRVRILAALTERPAQTFRGLCKQTGIPAGSLRSHLNQLRRFGHVREMRVGPCLRIFPADLSANARLASLLDEQNLAGVYAFVAIHGPISQQYVLQEFPGPRSTTQHRLKRLERLGMLKTRWSGRRKLYSVPAQVVDESVTMHPLKPVVA